MRGLEPCKTSLGVPSRKKKKKQQQQQQQQQKTKNKQTKKY